MSQKILIVGGGIGGLTLLASFKKKGIDATLIERAPKFENIGYVIGLFPNGLSILRHLGLHAQIIDKGEILERYVLKDMRGKDVWEYSLSDLEADLPAIELERSVLQDALVEANVGNDVRLGVVATDIIEGPEGVSVTTSDGTRETYDIVVGADGINSQIRKMVDPKRRQTYTRFTYWMTWVPKMEFASHKMTNYIGKGRLLGLFPSKGSDRMMAFFGVSAKEHSYTDPHSSLQALFGEFRSENPVLDNVLEALPAESATLFHHDDDEVHGRVWSKGRFVLLGDAVHALSPLLGMGASMAMEDAYVLAEEISRGNSPEKTFSLYEARRKPRVHKLVRASRILHGFIILQGMTRTMAPFLFSMIGGPRYKNLLKRLVKVAP